MALWRVLKHSIKNTNADFVSVFIFLMSGGKSGIRSATLFLFTCFCSFFLHSFCFFIVAITRKEIHLHSKDENGIQPFPASGSPTAGFSLSLKCERRQQVAAYFIPTSFHKNKRVGFAPRHYFSSLVFVHFFFTHFASSLSLSRRVANNRFIGCLVGSFFLKISVKYYEPTSNPFESHN